MDDSSKKIVMIITAAALGTMAVMAFNNYNQPAPDAAIAPEPAPAEVAPAATPSPPQSSPPVNDSPTIEDIPAIDGAPSMILDNVNGSQDGQGNKDAPAPVDNVQ